MQLAALRVARRDYAEAERLYRHAEVLDPCSAEIQYNLGLLAVDRRDLGEAWQRHRTLLGIDPVRAAGLSEMIRAIASPAGEARSGGR